jgi:hypothetical protein
MQISQGNTLAALRGVQAFLDAHSDVLSAAATSGARKKLDALVETLSDHATIQTGSILASKGATQKQYALRKALLEDHMAPIARIAAADLPQTPELTPLKMPRGRPSTETLHSAATGMAEAAQPYVAVFTAAGLPADFITQLVAAADAMLVPIDTRTQNRGKRNGATKGLKETVRSALKTVRVLDSFVRPVIKDDPALLATWDSVRRPPAKAGRAAGTTTAPTPPATPSAPAVPAST